MEKISTYRRQHRVTKRQKQAMYHLFYPAFSPAIKPTLKLRDSQLKIVHFLALDEKNYGVVCATSFGKNILNILNIDIFLQRGYQKIFILAPSVELCWQIFDYMHFFRDFGPEEVVILAGQTKKTRQKIYGQQQIHVYISTPQGIKNDLKKNIISPDYFDLVILDEAHRAVDNYAYTYIAEVCWSLNIKIIAQTATPWGDEEKQEKVKNDLYIQDWYGPEPEEELTWQQPITRIVKTIPLNEAWQAVWEEMLKSCQRYYQELYRVLSIYAPDLEILPPKFRFLKQKEIQDLRLKINYIFHHDKFIGGDALHAFGCMQKWILVIKYLFQENFEIAFNYFKTLQFDKTKAGKRVYHENYKFMKENVWQLFQLEIHPKISTLLELLEEHSQHQVVIFQNYIESIATLQEKYLQPRDIETQFLIGKGHSQVQSAKESKAVRLAFCNREFRILQASQVGQEGLHFPHLKTVIFLSIPKTEVEICQAEGRVGRTEPGTVIYIIFGYFDKVMYYSLRNRIKKMLDRVKRIPDIYIPVTKKSQASNLKIAKEKFWANELVNLSNQLIRERFNVIGIQQFDFKDKTKLLFNLFDCTGHANAELHLDKKNINHEKQLARYLQMKDKVVIASGLVRVTDTVDILIKLDQKQNIVLCPKKSFRMEDYQPKK